MNYKLIVAVSLLLGLFSCKQDTKPSGQSNGVVADSVTKQNSPVVATPEMEMIQNMEMVPYCVVIPMQEYEAITEESAKAQHSFVHKTKRNNSIELKGLLRSNTSVPIEQYFEESYQDAEMEGKIIEKKELLKAKGCFYAKGYWNNSINELRFIEICWLREGEVVKYESQFDIADTAAWNSYLKVIIETGSECK